MSQRFRLSFVNAAEDVPRLLRAYGRACGGEVALVLRPTEGTGLLVHLPKGGGASVWAAKPGKDAPAFPDVPSSAEEAVAAIKEAQRKTGRQGPITLRGQWSGYLNCVGDIPVVELRRKLATYAVLTIASRPGDGVWAWRVERLERWFSGPGEDTGEAPSLLLAVEAGLASAMGLLGQVCGQRDSRRRSAFDENWAEKHPVRAAKEGWDPTARMKPKAKRRRSKAKPRVSGSSSTAHPGSQKPDKRANGTGATRKRTTATTTNRRAPPESPKKPTTCSRPRRRQPATTTRLAPKATQSTTTSSPDAPIPDAAADQALLSAFKDAVQSALFEVP